MIGPLLLAVVAAAGGFVGTYTFDRSSPVYARLAMGAVLGFTVLAFAGFLAALQRANTEGGPPAGAHSSHRGGPISVYDAETRTAIEQLAYEIDAVRALEVWEAALAATWSGPDVWVHGDVTGSNLLLRDGRIQFTGTADELLASEDSYVKEYLVNTLPPW